MNRRLLLQIALHCILPMIVGMLIYYFFRPGVVFIKWMGQPKPITDVSGLGAVGKWLVYSGPDFCWSYSLASALFLWNKQQQKQLKFFPLLVLLLLLASELVQGTLFNKFVFDYGDLFAAVAAFWLSWRIINTTP